ncbi:class I adenylate cyclase [Inmirania thermothiophila]|uniref:Adenylate cyclase n=1 Tax=Inmirania thermothiophila TaxID=1750597 RepID=A0A3N1Y9V7_9GAMM|nr:class I adenylate cyclase [Inmirania thermothiophila]ROR34402.1 adenylate cyclase [Inmirania thermothiophila]
MATATGGIDLGTLQQLRRRFYGINRERLRRTRDALPPRQRVFLDVLPLLFHAVHEALPGHVGDGVPFGIVDYRPPRAAVAAAEALAEGFRYRRRALARYDLHGLYLIGSAGTVAHTDRSDFDLWVCHRSALGAEARAALRARCDAVERWAAGLGLEVHCFLIDPAEFRAGRHAPLSRESSGSTQHNLLRDEFYRSGLLLAGQHPLWWLVPPEADADYEAWTHRLARAGIVADRDCIDFGPLWAIPAGEFVGAALWHLYKAIASPYKSVLKLQLLEAYAEGPAGDTLARRFKAAVYGGETGVDAVDPYVMMINRVEEHLVARGELERLELARRCLYFKVGEPLSRSGAERPWRRRLLAELVARWGWDEPQLVLLDARPRWKIHRVLEERRLLVGELTRAYRALARAAAEQAAAVTATAEDLELLGRKLHAAFERRAGKVELVNPGISADLSEEALSLHEVRGAGARRGWLLFRGAVAPEDGARQPPLKRAPQLLELLAWCHLNGLVRPGTRIHLHAHPGGVGSAEVRAVLDRLAAALPRSALGDPPVERLGRAAVAEQLLVFVNLGVDPMAPLTRAGRQLVSDRTDPLQYGGARRNLVRTLDLLVRNSWGEVLTHRYDGLEGLLAALADHLRWAAGGVPPRPAAACFTPGRGGAIAARVEALFTAAAAALGPGGAGRFVFEADGRCCLLEAGPEGVRGRILADTEALLEALAAPQPRFRGVALDRLALAGTPLPAVLAAARPGRIQVLYEAEGGAVGLYVVDERGSLFHERYEGRDPEILLRQLQRFLEAVARRRALLAPHAAAAVGYARLRPGPGGWRAEPVVLEPGDAGGYYSVQVLVEEEADGRVGYRIYCGEREFTTLEHGEALFAAVRRHVLARRPSGARYPVYITDLDISRLRPDAGGEPQLQTIRYLAYKKAIEARLNAAPEGG